MNFKTVKKNILLCKNETIEIVKLELNIKTNKLKYCYSTIMQKSSFVEGEYLGFHPLESVKLKDIYKSFSYLESYGSVTSYILVEKDYYINMTEKNKEVFINLICSSHNDYLTKKIK